MVKDKKKQVLKIKEAMKKWGNSETKSAWGFICPLCRATDGWFDILSLIVFREIFSILEKRKALKRMDLVRATGWARSDVKEILDKIIELGWIVQDPKTKIVRLVL